MDILRRLSLTCFVLIFKEVASMIIFALGVSVITVVVQRETRPHLDPWLASISNLAHWQIVWCVLIILLLESNMMDEPNAFRYVRSQYNQRLLNEATSQYPPRIHSYRSTNVGTLSHPSHLTTLRL